MTALNKKMVKIATITLNWNDAQETLACVQSLLAAGAAAERLLVVDNGSTDDSLVTLQKTLPDDISLIANRTNQGFAAGNNVAIHLALKSNAEWIFLINNDTRAKEDLYAALTAATRLHPGFDILAPIIFYHDDPERIWSLGDRLIPGTLITRGLFKNQALPRQTLPDLIPVDFLNACALLVHRRVFEQIGGFDPGFFMYAEDVDFCWRARKAGFRLAAVPKAKIWHRVSWSAGATRPRTRYWQISNQIRFYRMAARGLQRPLMFCFSGLRALLRAGNDLQKGRHGLAKTTLQAWWQAWTLQMASPTVSRVEE